ncbi:unnamed protein product [Tenebrio molitor]|nr:unnamed protein product [Tenebrio molitor]
MFTILRRQIVQNLVKQVLNDTTKKTFVNLNSCLLVPSLIKNDVQHNLQSFRYKSKKGPKKTSQVAVSESETEKSSWEDQVADKHTKIMQVDVKSLRVDGVLKSGLGISRNKIETLFYESKIRVNGQKLMKKSDSVNEGDEIDIIKGVSVSNPDFLTVARVEILGITDKHEVITLKIRRSKSLTIENYDNASTPT